MTLSQLLGQAIDLRAAIGIGFGVALGLVLALTPIAIREMIGAGIVGRDRQKPDNPEVAEMGGLGVFLAFIAGVCTMLFAGGADGVTQLKILGGLIVCAGATLTGVIDDLIPIQQKVKALIPMGFALPLSIFIDDTTVDIPFVGLVDFSLAYPFVLVPIAITCASNSFNMLEGANGLGTGMGIVISAALIVLAILGGDLTGLYILVPLLGALVGFFWFNSYPAKVFPGDTMTLFVGAALAVAAILSKVEFWGALLFIPYFLEFTLKAINGFPSKGWWGVYKDGKLHCPPHGPVGLVQAVMKVTGGIREPALVFVFIGCEALVGVFVILSFAGWAA